MVRRPLQAGARCCRGESSCVRGALDTRGCCCSLPSSQWTVFLSQDTNGYSSLASQEKTRPVGELLQSLGRRPQHQGPAQVKGESQDTTVSKQDSRHRPTPPHTKADTAPDSQPGQGGAGPDSAVTCPLWFPPQQDAEPPEAGGRRAGGLREVVQPCTTCQLPLV